MAWIGLVTVFLWCFASSAETLSQIHSINKDSDNKTTVLNLSDGRVGKLSFSNEELLERLEIARHQKAWLEIKLNDRKEVVGIHTVPKKVKKSGLRH